MPCGGRIAKGGSAPAGRRRMPAECESTTGWEKASVAKNSKKHSDKTNTGTTDSSESCKLGEPRKKRQASKRPIFLFVLAFVFLLMGFYAITFIPYLNMKLLPALQVVNAKTSAVLMNIFGEGAAVRDTTISSARYSVNIAHGCDAIEPIALFVAAVLAFPASVRSKLPGLLVGVAMLCILNLIRIISLFYTGVYWPSMFEIMHIDIWQPAFVVFSLFFWVVWALWATKPTPRPQHASV